MASVGTKNTWPEILVRKMLHREGYRYRLHRADLPGKPDIVFPGRKKIIFVHGCFWHGHRCRGGKLPKSRKKYWEAKHSTNKARDKRNARDLKRMGWDVLVVWQCQIRTPERILAKIVNFLEN